MSPPLPGPTEQGVGQVDPTRQQSGRVSQLQANLNNINANDRTVQSASNHDDSTSASGDLTSDGRDTVVIHPDASPDGSSQTPDDDTTSSLPRTPDPPIHDVNSPIHDVNSPIHDVNSPVQAAQPHLQTGVVPQPYTNQNHNPPDETSQSGAPTGADDGLRPRVPEDVRRIFQNANADLTDRQMMQIYRAIYDVILVPAFSNAL